MCEGGGDRGEERGRERGGGRLPKMQRATGGISGSPQHRYQGWPVETCGWAYTADLGEARAAT